MQSSGHAKCIFGAWQDGDCEVMNVLFAKEDTSQASNDSISMSCYSADRFSAGKSKNAAALKKVVPEWLDKGVLSARVGEPLIYFPVPWTRLFC